MRKAFWISAVAAVGLACSVYLAATFGPRTPQGAAAMVTYQTIRHGLKAGDKKRPQPPVAVAPVHTECTTGCVEESTSPDPEVVAVARTEMPSHIVIERAPEMCVPYTERQDFGNAPTSAILGSQARMTEECIAAVPVMPYCTDEVPTHKCMPYADDAGSCPKDCAVFEYYLGFMDRSEASEESKPAEPKVETVPLPSEPEIVPLPKTDDEEEEDMEEPQEEMKEEAQPQTDPHHYHHNCQQDYIVCPYSGKCYPREPQPSTPSEKPLDVKAEEDKPSEGCKTDCNQCEKSCTCEKAAADSKCCCKEKGAACTGECQCDGKCKCCKDGEGSACGCAKKVKKGIKVKIKVHTGSEPCECPKTKEKKTLKGLGDCEEQEESPSMHPQVDTMEFRPSDAIPYSIFPGPF